MNVCPECREKYDRVMRGMKVTIPEDTTVCHRSVKLADGGTVGKWYVHES